MSVFICYALSFYLIEKKKNSLWLILIFVTGALLSFRLRPLVTVSGALLIAIFIFRNKAALRAIFLAGVAGLFLFVAFRSTIISIIDLKLLEFDVQSARYKLTATSLRLAQDHFPFGSGLGTFGGYASRLFYSPVYFEYGLSTVYGLTPEVVNGQDYIMDTHWPYILGELGIMGLLAYLISIAAVGRQLIHHFRRSTDPFLKSLALGATLVLIQGIISAFVAPVFQVSLSGYYTFVFSGVLYAIAHPWQRTFPHQRDSL
jgi:hypothetical protein